MLIKFKNKMKKFIKITLSLLFVLIVTIIAVPYFLKDDIEKFLKEEINNSINAKLDYDDLSLSLLSDFPNLKVKIHNFTLDGINEFKNTRLAQIDQFDMSLDVKKLLFNKDLEIKRIGVDGADIRIKVLKNGKANYDIAKPDSIQKPENKQNYVIKLQSYKIDHTNIMYDDESLNMKLKIKNMHQKGTGVFTKNDYALAMQTTADTLDVIYDGIHYLNNVKTNIDNKILIENDFSKYTIKDAKINLNDLALTSDMMFELKDKDIDMDITYATKENSLKKLLSLVPKAYLPDMKSIQANGIAGLKGFVKGTYNEQNYPAYGVDFKINKGQIKYPDLPQAITNINVITQIDFPGGKDLDATKINIPTFHFDLAGSKTDGQLAMAHTMTDPYIDMQLKSNLDLAQLKQAIKMPEIKKLTGLLKADFSLKGRSSDIEKQNFNKFKAAGFFNLENMTYASDDIPYDISVQQAAMDINPQALQIKQTDAKIGESDFHLKGNLKNYITYFLKKDQVLKADFNMHSNYLNMNEFMTDETSKTQDTTAVASIKIPKNLDINFVADADKMLYKDLHLNNVKGTVKVKDEKAILETVLLKTLGGDMHLKGTYDTSKEIAETSMQLNMQKMSLSESAEKLSLFETYTPVFKKLQGQFFSNLNLQVDLDNQMNPVLNTLDASGLFSTANISIGGIDVVKKIGELLKINELKNPKVDKVKAQFDIKKGHLYIKPFQFKMNNIQSGLKGNISLDQKIDFVLNMKIPKNMLGGKANEIIENLVGKLDKLGLKAGLGDMIDMQFKITGDYNKPKIIPLIAGTSGNSAKEVITQAVEQKVEEVIDDTKEKARAEAQKKADALIKQAQAQADQLVAQAKKTADQIRKEADKQAQNLIKKAGNDPFKKIAAETMAKKIKKEAEKKAKKIETEAQNKANLIMKNAQEKADKLVQNLD